jgi:hypothetical protein
MMGWMAPLRHLAKVLAGRESLANRGPSMNKTARIAWAVMHRQENYQRMATAV